MGVARRLSVGIVGCGEVTQLCHLPSLALLPEHFRVAALCDASRAVVEGVGAAWGVAERGTDYRELVARADLDVVLIAAPHALHAEIALAALAAGKHLLIEKPMCLTLREADAIDAARRAAGVRVQVGYMRRHAPAFLEACRMVRELGSIRLARVHDVIGRNALITGQVARVIRGDDLPGGLIAATRARQDEAVREAIGAATPELANAYMLLLGLGSHDTSAMRELLGMPRGVLYAAQRQGGRSLSAAFDYGDYVCHFETGVDEIPRFDCHLEVYGADRVLRVEYDTPYVRHLPVRLSVTAAEGAGVAERQVQPDWGDPFVAEWRAFHGHIIGGSEPKNSPEDFRADLELFGAMIERMR